MSDGKDGRYAILFEPVQIGPVIAPNRFYQVPHCTGFGHRMPEALAAMRGMKAEGGWGVVCTEEVEIHPSADVSPAMEGRLWGDYHIPYHQLTCDAVHAHGALAGIELVHGGLNAANLTTRCAPMAPSNRPLTGNYPMQARAMDKADIRAFRQWHIDAALRAQRAGYDIIYAYAGHNMTLLMHFLLARYNDRADEYGGSLENRVRLLKEVLSDLKDNVGDRCAIALRFCVDELLGGHGLQSKGEARDVIGLLAELPDLWDVNLSDWQNDSQSARFSEEAYQDSHTRFVKSLTTKPVVGVGRYTSVDGFVQRIKSGHLDFIGAARPSIADPFLPNKIANGALEDIRECIGCNICVASDQLSVPIRCTQNPTMGEEWRLGWHPEQIEKNATTTPVLVVGAGPAGMECAMQLGKRGYQTHLAEAQRDLGGRLIWERQLPGMASYGRVHDYRLQQMQSDKNISIYRESKMTLDDVIAFGPCHVILACGAFWRDDLIGRTITTPLPSGRSKRILTPEDIMCGVSTSLCGDIVIWDDDNYYLGYSLAVICTKMPDVRSVTIITAHALVGSWGYNTLELEGTQKLIHENAIIAMPNHKISGVGVGAIDAVDIYTDVITKLPCDDLISVSARLPNNEILMQIADYCQQPDHQIRSYSAIGDCHVPGIIAHAIYSGHRAARNLDSIGGAQNYDFISHG